MSLIYIRYFYGFFLISWSLSCTSISAGKYREILFTDRKNRWPSEMPHKQEKRIVSTVLGRLEKSWIFEMNRKEDYAVWKKKKWNKIKYKQKIKYFIFIVQSISFIWNNIFQFLYIMHVWFLLFLSSLITSLIITCSWARMRAHVCIWRFVNTLSR